MSNFEKETEYHLANNSADSGLRNAAAIFMRESIRAQYSYNFRVLGRPVIQYPQDIVAIQELIWQIKPDLIIETGIAHGGSLILSASMLALLDYCDAVENDEMLACEMEMLSSADVNVERIMLGIRLNEGLARETTVLDQGGLDSAQSRGWISIFGDRIQLTDSGRHFGQDVAVLLAPIT